MKKVLSYLKKYKVKITLSAILAAVVVVLTLYVPILIGEAVDKIVDAGNVDLEYIANKLILVVGLVIITAALQFLMARINNNVTYSVVQDIRDKAFRKFQTLPLKYLDSHMQGDIVSRIITDVDQFADGLLLGFTQLFTGIMTILITLVIMFGINVWVALVVVLVTPLSMFIANFISKKTYGYFREQSVVRGEQTSLIDEMIGNIKVVKAYAREEETLEKFDEINDRLQKCSVSAAFFSALPNPSTRFVNSVTYAGVALVGALMVITGKGMTIGTWTIFLSYVTQYTKPFNEISEVMAEFQNALACANRVFELIEEPSEVEDKKEAVVLEDVKGEVECEHVYFSYLPEQKLIEDFNLKVKPGQIVAVVGPTGCGKTTLINLLMRFYDTTGGSIKVDGVDVKDMTRESLRKNFGMVLQETWLKEGTIRDNITMGNPNVTDEQMIEAAKATHAHSFIKRLPNGYDTVIEEDGGMLSSGQKQLLCITRVMLAKPPMLILDEATSSIDTRTEIKVQRAFNKLMKDKTSFIVAHRLSTIQNADIILVMNQGKIIEQGNHETLLAKGGFYYNLYNSQFVQ